MQEENPIGFFDSGLGGLSVWKEVYALIPNENTIYLADSKYAPYGVKPKEMIIELSCKNTEYLLNAGCKMIVVACNTATTSAISYLREKYDVPFVGIEPAIKPAALSSKKKRVGVLATEGTLISDLFLKTSALYATGVETISQKGNGLVELIENGEIQSTEMLELLRSYVDPMTKQGIDYLVLGCTHYPFLRPLLKERSIVT